MARRQADKAWLGTLTPTHLLYFRALIDEGTMTAAAATLGVSQPSLSVAIKKMEGALDTTLLHRSRAGVEPTDAGKRLYARARDVLELLDSTRTELAEVEGTLRGRFVLGCHESLASYALPSFLRSFSEDFPGIELSLVNGNSRDVEEGIVRRELDLGLVVNPMGHEDCVIRELFTDRVMFIASPECIARASGRGVGRLSSLPLIYVPALRQSQALLAALDSKRIRPAREITCSSLALVKSFVLDGVGVGILPRRVAYHGVDGSALKALRGLPSYEDHVALVRRYDMHLTQAAKTTLQALEAHGKSIGAGPVSGS